ncbi:hypothetical protein [Microcystis aeruginosa]|uniref:hypothetical protein n=1 Tax=Microcystis aeruginosa TaxID=1126 RepID=UPI001C12B264|nr:hypothetical protein [Microcystis aeruginosa]
MRPRSCRETSDVRFVERPITSPRQIISLPPGPLSTKSSTSSGFFWDAGQQSIERWIAWLLCEFND